MSEQDDRDLSAAFEELRAPASTAGYATRTTGLEIRTTGARWPQALATALAVLVAVAGAGTFLALRNARQGGAPSSSTGAPPARTGAAMAYDSTSGVTVMFGGVGAGGKTLADTWTWNGSSWSAAAHGPGPLAGARLVDDTADGGVLLLGAPAPPASGGVVSNGCSGGGTGVPGVTTTPAPSNAVAPAGSAPATQPKPPVGPVPTDAVPSPGSTVRALPASLCPAPVAPPSVQTWVFNGSGWHRAAPGAEAASPPAGADLAFDSSSRQVVAVSPPGIRCGPPLEVPLSSGADIACPALGGAGSSAAIAPYPCPAATDCANTMAVSSWAWSAGSWRKEPADPNVQPSGETFLFDDPATHHATLVTESGVGASPECVSSRASCLDILVPTITTWTWKGSGWTRTSQVPGNQETPNLAGAAIASIDGSLVVLTSDGQTWTRAAGQWTQDLPAGHPQARTGAAIAEGPNGTVVLFGGVSSPSFVTNTSSSSIGSDTWTWTGSAWRQLGGTAPVPPPSPSPLPCGTTGNKAAPPGAPCVSLLPAPAPGAPGVAPASTPTPSP